MPRGKQNAPKYVFVAETCHVRTPGSKYPTLITKGEAWYAESDIVRAHPHLFVEHPTVVNPRGWSPPVEQATAAPGEVRTTARAED